MQIVMAVAKPEVQAGSYVNSHVFFNEQQDDSRLTESRICWNVSASKLCRTSFRNWSIPNRFRKSKETKVNVQKIRKEALQGSEDLGRGA